MAQTAVWLEKGFQKHGGITVHADSLLRLRVGLQRALRSSTHGINPNPDALRCCRMQMYGDSTDARLR
jgi:hypothetical protein